MIFNYPKICNGLLSDLAPRTKEVIERRFCLLPTTSNLAGKTKQRETLESIGKDFGITRERVRQIEEDGFSKFKPKTKQCENVFQYFDEQLKKAGNIRREDILLETLGRKKFQNHVFFLLTLGQPFKRLNETKEFYTLWTTNSETFLSAKKILSSFCGQLRKRNKPLSAEGFVLPENVASSFTISGLPSCLEIFKTIQRGPDGLFGLRDWPEINPRGVKDWAYLVLKKTKKPCHFTEVAKLINKFYKTERQTLPQTVHNELIKDARFVLVGRGIYGLKEWGYESGVVKEVIAMILKKAKKPLAREEIVKEALNQRFVKENTILLNLNNKSRFLKNEKGKYTIKQI